MKAPKIRSLLRMLIPVAAVTGLLALAGGAHAEATVQSLGPFTEPLTTTVVDDCRGGLVGQLTGTTSTTFQLVSVPTGGHAQIEGTQTATFRIDYGDGSYALGTYSSPFQSGGPFMHVFTETNTLLAPLTIYDANGGLLGTETFHLLHHLIVTIIDGNATARTTLDSAHLTCNV